MARPGFIDHPKFRRLCFMLKLPEPYVLGLCECLWAPAYHAGNPRIGDATDVELAAKWPGEPGAFFNAVLACGGAGRAGLIEPCPDEEGAFRIHDLDDHCPEYVRSRNRMERYRKRNRSENEQTVAQPLRNGYGSPAPAPAPAPIEKSPEPQAASEPESGGKGKRAADASPRKPKPQPEDESPIVLTFPVKGNGEWHLHESKLSEYRQTFPHLDVLAEVRKARQWAIDNTPKRKTAGRMPAFLTSWLSRAQDSGRGTPAQNGQASGSRIGIEIFGEV